ncbi:hypothetical protein HY485_05155 [Candidatus Woesearchaeota archaeon]|nr:hypothetical protein [Candidatus Woesearchaeota archaeon]
MKKNKDNVKVWYDKKSDFLEITTGAPVKAIYRPLGNECFERIDKRTRKIVGLAIFNFTKRFPKQHQELSIPVEIQMKSMA